MRTCAEQKFAAKATVFGARGTLCFVCTMQTNGISVVRKISNIYIDIFKISVIMILDKILIGGLKYV